MYIYYHIYKNYKGLFRRKHQGNNQIFTFPEVPSEPYFTNGVIIGKVIAPDEEYNGALAYMSLAMDDIGLVDRFISSLREEMGKKLELLEKLPCSVSSEGEMNFTIKIPKKGEFIKSNLDLIYSDASSKEIGRKMFYIKGDVNLYTNEVTPQTMKMVAFKKMAYLKRPLPILSSSHGL